MILKGIKVKKIILICDKINKCYNHWLSGIDHIMKCTSKINLKAWILENRIKKGKLLNPNSLINSIVDLGLDAGPIMCYCSWFIFTTFENFRSIEKTI